MQITQNIANALNGTLETSDTTGVATQYQVTNNMAVPLYAYVVGPTGLIYGSSTIESGDQDGYDGLMPGSPGATLAPGASVNVTTLQNVWIIFTMQYSGAFACALQTPDPTVTTDLSVDSSMLLDPNDIGSVPKPTPTVIIPPDSPHVMVGCGTVPTLGWSLTNYVVREQYWTRRSDSHTLAPTSSETVSYTVTQGMQTTTSSTETLSKAVSVSASAGWGPFSASISASLNKSTTTTQQLTMSTQNTVFTSDTIENPTNDSRMLLYWQLMDVITVYSNLGTPLASIVTAILPVVIDGPYAGEDLLAMPAPKIRRQVSRREIRNLARFEKPAYALA